jgi:hypothetical protein
MTIAYRTDRVAYVNGFGISNPIPVVARPDVTLEVPGNNAAVPPNILTTLVSYTNVGTEPLFLDGWIGTGEYEGDWFLVIDTVTKPEDRSSASTMRAGIQFTSPRRIEPGSIIDIKVEHYGGATGQFSATLYGHR